MSDQDFAAEMLTIGAELSDPEAFRQLQVTLAEYTGRCVVHVGQVLPGEPGIGPRCGGIGQEAEVLRAAELHTLLVGEIHPRDVGEPFAQAAADLEFL